MILQTIIPVIIPVNSEPPTASDIKFMSAFIIVVYVIWLLILGTRFIIYLYNIKKYQDNDYSYWEFWVFDVFMAFASILLIIGFIATKVAVYL
jgi:hypothetical protein